MIIILHDQSIFPQIGIAEEEKQAQLELERKLAEEEAERLRLEEKTQRLRLEEAAAKKKSAKEAEEAAEAEAARVAMGQLLAAAASRNAVMPASVCASVQSCGERKQSSSSHWKVNPTFIFGFVVGAPSASMNVRNEASVKRCGSCCSHVTLRKAGEVGALMKKM